MKQTLFLLTIIGILPLNGLAWGGRGHQTICEAAGFLVESQDLKEYLKSKGHMMGHLCNIPDTYWRGLGKESTEIGNPTHYIDVDILGLPISKVDLDFKKLSHEFLGKNKATSGEPIKNLASELGSVWWRADQFFRLAVAPGSPPSSPSEFNSHLDRFFLNIGIMGHYVGDVSQPFHNTDDYDGKAKGHSGIHSYFEETAVSSSDEKLLSELVSQGLALLRQSKIVKFRNSSHRYLNDELSVKERMQALSDVSYSEIDAVIKADRLNVKTKNADAEKAEIERMSLKKTYPQFKKIFIVQMARSAALLAQLWNQAYVQLGNPDLKKYKSYNFPHKPDFVPPDYL